MARTHHARDSYRVAVPCTRCRNFIHAPASVKVGMGPCCRDKARAERDARRRLEEWALFPAPAQVITLEPGHRARRGAETAA